MTAKIVTVDDIYDGLMEIEKYVYVENAKGRIPNDVFQICLSLISMCKKTAIGLSARQSDINLVELNDDGKPTVIVDTTQEVKDTLETKGNVE